MHDTPIQAQLEELHRASYGWALRCCSNNPENAEDVLQTVYLKILEGRARYDGEALFKTWLFTLIRHTAIDMFRQYDRHQHKLERYQTYQPIEQSSNPDDALDHAQKRDQLQQALEMLSDRQQEVLHLVLYQELSIQQAAEIMEISLGSARTHYERGKQRLHQVMESSNERQRSCKALS